MKVLGGITCLTQQPDALNRFCSTAPVLSSLGEEFLERNNICSYDKKTPLSVNWINLLTNSFKHE